MAIGQITGSIGEVAASLSQGVVDITTIVAADFLAALRPASIGGVPFGVYEARTFVGRRNVVHEYPYRDESWVEDIGRQPRRFDIVGFLVANSQVYGGGSLARQRANLMAVIENLPSATLVHPTLGTIDGVNVLAFDMDERIDLGGNVLEFRLALIQGSALLFPSNPTATDAALAQAADGLDTASLSDFQSTVAVPLLAGAAVVQEAVNVANLWYGQAVTAVRDVRRFWSAVSSLPGNFGRYFGGANAGFRRSNPTTAGATIASLTVADAQARAVVVQAGAGLAAAAASVSDIAGFGAAVKGLAAAVAATAADPADAIRLGTSLAVLAPAIRFGASPVGQAVAVMQDAAAALMRRAALAQVVRAVARYQPASVDEARTLRRQLADLITDEIVAAGDGGDTESYRALRVARAAIVVDLERRTGGLAALRDYAFGQPMPSLVLAHRLYGDTTREPGLVKQAAPIHPLFMPTQFRALAS